MSRYHLSISEYPHKDEKVDATLFYGFDHVTGYFYQVYVSDEYDPVENHDSLQGLTRSKMLERFDELSISLPAEHHSAIALDLPF